MPRGNRLFTQDLTLRASGLLLLALGALAMRYLFHMVHVLPGHEASPAEMGLAMIGFMSLSAGAALISLGAHIFDEVEISARWARRPVRYPVAAFPRQEELRARFDPRAPISARLPMEIRGGAWGDR